MPGKTNWMAVRLSAQLIITYEPVYAKSKQYRYCTILVTYSLSYYPLAAYDAAWMQASDPLPAPTSGPIPGIRGSDMRKTYAATAIAVLLLMVLTSLALAAPPAEHVATPFKGTLHGHETYDFQNNSVLVSGNGWGVATRLGTYKLHYEAQVNHITGVGAGTNATEHFTAANGDRIDATGTGLGVPTATPGIQSITEWYTITGGTGRFAGASGRYTVHRMVVLATGETWGSFDGTIRVPDKD